MIHIQARVDAERGTREMREARKQLGGKLKIALREAGEEVALPAARRGAARYRVGGQSVAMSLKVRSTTRSAYITTSLRGKLGRAVGLLEFGGTVRTKVEPKKAKAIMVGSPEILRAHVSGPRHYPGIGFLQESVHGRRRQIELRIRDRVLDAFLPEFDVS